MNKLIYLFPIIFLATLFSCKKNNTCSCISPSVAVDKYDYPVKPGSPQWNAAIASGIGQYYPLDSVYKLCQIPNVKLQAMSTLGLIQSLTENPCLLNMFLRDNKFLGRDEVLSRLNVSWALNKRVDAGLSIISYYETKDPNCVKCLNSDLEKGTFQINWEYFDMICTQDSILNQLDKANCKKLAKIVSDKFKIQIKYPQTFGSSRTSSVLILSQIMIKQNFQPYLNALQTNPNLSSFALTGILTGDFYNLILEFSNQFINS